ncbi:uncharacterized protein LOC106515226 [Austrofundulus limnaeus]|uniref:Uncharacterized protein LOC106515226 n=1 Tax=Austrofundulus limnaeus TaxID=52670 RepID=A0A2I4AY02_AUSLI|nr:PREDICTED: uncharacterized protein LOC106515226 [Austrofundulus limnaeus]
MLYRNKEKVNSQVPQSAAEEVQFTVRVEHGGSDQPKLFCCLYKNQGGHYSAFSPYLQLELQGAEGTTPSLPLLPPPNLSVEPSSGIKRGDMIRFHCTVPDPLSQSSSPPTFLLRRTFGQTSSMISQLQAGQASNSEPQPGFFTVGPVGQREEGEYSCIYQINKRTKLVNSSDSNVVKITVTNVLPVPSLVLQQQTDVWSLLCTGSPAYPGATFSLYLENYELPVESRRVRNIQHQATFPVPVQDSPVALYQCQYTVQLGMLWRTSERSVPLAVTRGTSTPASQGVDWPLLLGSISAALLFLFSLVLVVVVAKRKVKAAAEEKKRREEAQFWTQRHTQDHVIDLTLRPISLTPQEWSSRDAETASRSSLWNPFSTFTTPIHSIH